MSSSKSLFSSALVLFAVILAQFSNASLVSAAGTVGTGTAASCTEAALNTALSGGGAVIFDCGAAPVTITISATKTISSNTQIDGGGLITISGGNAVRIFTVQTGVSLSLADIRLANGNSGTVQGGAILINSGATAIITDSTFSNNTSAFNSAAVGIPGGAGAIYNAGTLTITGSTFSGNTATGPGGDAGAIMSLGSLTISNSTFVGNSAVTNGSGGTGGALRLEGGAGPNSLTYVTFSGNANDATWGNLDINNTSATLRSSIVANSVTGLDCMKRGSGTLTSTNNLIENGSSCSPAITLDPGLGPLQDNGGPTQTMAITASSPAYNYTLTCLLTTDQRGVARPQPAGGNCDLGAFELDSDNTPPTVTMSSAAPDPTTTSPIPVTVQFSEAITGFTATDITPGNATVANFIAVDPDTYTFDLTPTGPGSVTANIAAGVAIDPAGNNNTAAAPFSRTFNTTVPTATTVPGTPLASIMTGGGQLPNTGFPQGAIHHLPVQPDEKAYASTELWVEIPKLDVKMSIVGVPLTKGNWDVTWLGNNAGWLHGSAYPTWSGNSVLTGHVWDAFNRPGPFSQLKNLKYGDQIRIRAFGQVYVYEIRENQIITPTNVSRVFKHEEKPWLTLITCEDYKESSHTYAYRRMARAVLIRVTADD